MWLDCRVLRSARRSSRTRFACSTRCLCSSSSQSSTRSSTRCSPSATCSPGAPAFSVPCPLYSHNTCCTRLFLVHCALRSQRLPQRMVVGGIFAVGAFVVAAFVQLAIDVCLAVDLFLYFSNCH